LIKSNMKQKEIESKIKQIEDRNKRVELDKKWEISLTRKIIIMTFTYLIIGLFMKMINVNQPWLNAIIPTTGFFLSTLALPFIKSIWIKYQK
jgi:hypothetical protein